MRYSDLHNDQIEGSPTLKKNRKKLIQQNSKLYLEIMKLDKVISNIVQKNVESQIEIQAQKQQHNKRYGESSSEQLKLIVSMKNKIKKLKAAHAEQKFNDVKDQQNSLKFLKKEYENIYKEKQVLERTKKQKINALEYQKPLNNQVQQVKEKVKSNRTTNDLLRMKIHNIQKQIAKYHNLKESSKMSSSKVEIPHDEQIKHIEEQCKKMKNEMTAIDSKWRTKIQNLDKQYFGFKNVLLQKNAQIEKLQKQYKNLEIKILSYRDEGSVQINKQRLSLVVISQSKRTQMINIISQYEKKIKNIPKSQRKRVKGPSKEKQINNEKIKIDDNIEKEKQQQNTIHVQKNESTELQFVNRQKEAQGSTVKTKKFENVGVGTTFYYSEDQNI